MADHAQPDMGEEQEVSSSGLLLSVNPLQGAMSYKLSADDTKDKDTTDVAGDDSDASDADESDTLGGDSDSTDAGDADASDGSGSDADGTDVSDADGEDTGLDADGMDPLGIAHGDETDAGGTKRARPIDGADERDS
jgi:cobalamin biosynthesis protein CobT